MTDKNYRPPGGLFLEITIIGVLIVGVIYLFCWSQSFYTRVTNDVRFSGGRWIVFPFVLVSALLLKTYFDKRHSRLIEQGQEHSLSNPNGQEVFYAFTMVAGLPLFYWITKLH